MSYWESIILASSRMAGVLVEANLSIPEPVADRSM